MNFLPPNLTLGISCFLVESRSDKWWINKAFFFFFGCWVKESVAQGKSWSCTEFKVPHSSSICSFHPESSNVPIFPTHPLATVPDLFLFTDSRVSAYKLPPNCLTSSCSLPRSLGSNQCIWTNLSPILCTCPPLLHAFAHSLCLLHIPACIRTRELTLWRLFKTTGCQKQ